MIDITNWLEQDPIDACMILQVHDELVFEVKEDDVALARGSKILHGFRRRT